MANEVILLDFWASPYAMRVKIFLAEKGIEYECREEDLLRNKSTLLLEMNPIHKKIPVLIHNGRPVCESFIILQYIDEVNMAVRRVWIAKGDAHEAARKELIWGLKLLEGELGDKTYFGGDTFGVLDMVVIPTSSWFHVVEIYGGFSMIEECPKIVDWVKRCLKRNNVAKLLPDQLKVYEFSVGAKKVLEALNQAKS